MGDIAFTLRMLNLLCATFFALTMTLAFYCWRKETQTIAAIPAAALVPVLQTGGQCLKLIVAHGGLFYVQTSGGSLQPLVFAPIAPPLWQERS